MDLIFKFAMVAAAFAAVLATIRTNSDNHDKRERPKN